MELISVIVPVYNVEVYLGRCIDSIIDQTYTNLEIILVDDGSPDNCGKICDEYKERDRRVKVIHKENGGLSSARNAGLEIATGDLVGFVDSDDCITTDMYEHLYKIIKETNSDISSIKAKITPPNHIVNPSGNNDSVYQVDTRERILESYLEGGEFSCCVNLYKRVLFNEIKFPEGRINEDIVTNFKLFSKASRIVRSSRVCYIYYLNPGSITTSGFKRKDYDLKRACEELYSLAALEQSKRVKYLAKVRRDRCDFSLLCKIAMYGVEDEHLNKREEVKKLLRGLRQNYLFLIAAPLQFNRKIMLSLMFISFDMFEVAIKIYRSIRR